MRSIWMVASLALVAGLAACTERPQEVGKRVVSQAANAGTGNAAYTDAGWKPGDATSWEEHMRNRTQSGQNEYVRSTGK
jgi:hypothetical protein